MRKIILGLAFALIARVAGAVSCPSGSDFEFRKPSNNVALGCISDVGSNSGKLAVPYVISDQNVSALSFSNLSGGSRTIVSSALTIYVDGVNGSNAYTGLSLSQPFLTVQKAVDYVCDKLIIDTSQVTIQLSTGTYNEQVVLRNYVGSPRRESTTPIIQGMSVSTMTRLTSSGITIGGVGVHSNWTLKNLQIDSAGTVGVLADWGSSIDFAGHVTLSSATSNMIFAQYGSRVEFLLGSTITVKGTSGGFVTATNKSIALSQGDPNQTYIIFDSPTLSNAGIQAYSDSIIDLHTAQVSGSFTGTRFYINNSNIVSGSAMPGSSAGIGEHVINGQVALGLEANQSTFTTTGSLQMASNANINLSGTGFIKINDISDYHEGLVLSTSPLSTDVARWSIGPSNTPPSFIFSFHDGVASHDYHVLDNSGNVGLNIGARVPVTTLEVNGSASFGSDVNKSTFNASGALIMASTSIALGNVTAAIGNGHLAYDRSRTELLIGNGASTQAVRMGSWNTWTPTFTGFSADPTVAVARYARIGKTIVASLKTNTGTSNATTFTIGLPAVSNGTIAGAAAGQCFDNGSFLSVPCLVELTAGSAVATIYSSYGYGTWTAANGKSANFTITYETSQ